MDHGGEGYAGENYGNGGATGNGGTGCGDPTAANNCCANNEDEQAKILAAMKAKLTPMEFRVTQEKVTERPFSNRYNRHFESGSYHCVVCDTELFKSETKFESKSGWPAFYNVVDENRIKLKADTSHIGANILLLLSRPDLARNEVSCAFCKSHLGHLFQDGPKPTGLRYCVNSNSLIFHPKSEEPETEKEKETQINNNANGNAISDSSAQTISNCISTDQTDKTDIPPRAAGENMPSQKMCININSNGNGNGTKSKDKNSSAPRRDSAPGNSTQNKGKFCIFTKCLPKESAATSSPETSPSTQKHYYKPTSNSTGNGKSAIENNAATSKPEPEPKSTKSEGTAAAAVARKGKVKGRAPPPPTTLNLKKDTDEKSQDQAATATIRRFGTDVPSPTTEIIETVTRRPSNGVLRETFL